jgi:hypothetical protein
MDPGTGVHKPEQMNLAGGLDADIQPSLVFVVRQARPCSTSADSVANNLW